MTESGLYSPPAFQWVIDTHCHIHLGSSIETPGCGCDVVQSSDVDDFSLCEEGDVIHPITMGIREDDWERVIDFSVFGLSWRERTFRSPKKCQEDEEVLLMRNKQGKDNGSLQTCQMTSGSFLFGLGLHPWCAIACGFRLIVLGHKPSKHFLQFSRYAHRRTTQWLERLTALLEEHPRAIVGEIGLDKVAKTPDTHRVEWGTQLEVFHEQMALAARLSRPVSVHCVKAHGTLLDAFRKGEVGKAGNEKDRVGEYHHRLPPRIALQFFTGSIEVTKDILRLRLRGVAIFFGFSALVNMRGEKERKKLSEHLLVSDPICACHITLPVTDGSQPCDAQELLRLIPNSQVLVETDRHSFQGCTSDIMRVCSEVALAKRVSLEEAVTLVNANARLFLALAPTHPPSSFPLMPTLPPLLSPTLP